MRGFRASEIIQFLLSRVFDHDQEELEEYLPEFLKGITKTNAFTKRDFSEGISRIITIFPDLCLDYPQLHHYLYTFVVVPLLEAESLEMRQLNFRMPKADVVQEEPDEDDVEFNNSDCLFKFLGLLLVGDFKGEKSKGNWEMSISYIDRMYELKKLIKEQIDNLEEKEETLEEIKDLVEGKRDKRVLEALFSGDEKTLAKELKG